MTNYRDLFKDPMDHLPEIPKLEPSTQDKLLEAGADIGVGLAVNKMAGGGLPGLVLGGIAAYKTDEVARDYLGELKTGQEPPDGTSAQNEAIALGVGIVAGFIADKALGGGKLGAIAAVGAGYGADVLVGNYEKEHKEKPKVQVTNTANPNLAAPSM